MLDWWLPENVSTYGQEIDWLFHLIYYITGATFVLVFVTMLVFLVMYRDRPGRRARYTHGNTTLEIVWTVVPALILVILTILSVPAWSKIKMTMPETDFVVQVTAKQFNWQVTYPGRDRARRARRPPRARLRADLHLRHGPQDDRPAVPVPGALHDDPRRAARAHRPLAARLARDGRARPRRHPHGDGRHPGAEHLQHGVHHARDDHDLLRDHADPGGRLRELLHPADDRGA